MPNLGDIMKFIKDKLVCLHWSNSATSRTKNRIREHGPTFKVRIEPKAAQCFPGQTSVMLDGIGGSHWSGWIPVSDLIIRDND